MEDEHHHDCHQEEEGRTFSEVQGTKWYQVGTTQTTSEWHILNPFGETGKEGPVLVDLVPWNQAHDHD